MASEGFHESEDSLREETRDDHRATVSLMEELEAIDWYNQRVDAAGDPQLREILVHNRDDEKEHASMLLEWLRRRDPQLDSELRHYLFKPGAISEQEGATGGPGGAVAADGSLGIGSLHGQKDL
jgi:ferritin-like protein